MFVVSLETGEKRQLTGLERNNISDPAVSPDGRWLLFKRNLVVSSGQLYLLPLGKGVTTIGEPRPLTTGLGVDYATWMPDGKEVLFSAGGRGLWRVPITGNHGPVRVPLLAEDVVMPAVSPPAWNPPRLVYVRAVRVSSIWRIATSAPGAKAVSGPVEVIASNRFDLSPQLSPDGRRVAFSSTRSGSGEIWLADPDGSNAVRLTSMRAAATGTPRWSPDGRLIAFDSTAAGHSEVYLISAAGGKPSRVTFHASQNRIPSFSRDGKWIYFASNRTGESQIWKVPTGGGDAVQVTRNTGFVAFESPDGAYVYYLQGPEPSAALWRVPVSGGQPEKLLDGVASRGFAVLEKGVYYIERSADQGQLQFFDFATRKSSTVARNLGEPGQGLTVSPDGLTILYSQSNNLVNDLMLVENFR